MGAGTEVAFERANDAIVSALASSADDGPLFINPIIFAEVSVRFSRIEDVEEALPPSDYGRLDATRYRTYFPTVQLTSPDNAKDVGR